MAKKNFASNVPSAKTAPAVDPTIAKTGPSRNSPLPKAQPMSPAPRKEISREAIAKRAFEISRGPGAGDETSNWLRAERELKAL